MPYIFPTPKQYLQKDGEFVFSEKVYITIPSEFSNKDFTELIPELWSGFTAGKSFPVIQKSDRLKNAAVISNVPCETEYRGNTEHEYGISCRKECIIISHKTDIGLIHGFATLLQCIGAYRISQKNFAVGCFELVDSPALNFRCMHLCVFPETTLLFLKKAVRLFGLLKCTHIILEFFGTLKYDCFPYLSWENGYTKSQLLPIIKDGKAFGMEFIPMFNHMGHAGGSRFRAGKNVVLDSAPEYEEYFLPGGWTWNTDNPDVLRLHDLMRRELCELFGTGSYFHMGCDEVYAADSFCDPYDRRDNEQFMRFINNTAEKIGELGRTPIIWGDMFLDEREYPYPYCSNISHRCCDGVKNLSALAKNVMIADWQYNIGIDRQESVEFFLSQRDRDSLVLCPWTGFDNIGGRCAIAKEKELCGVIGTTWNDICRDPKFAFFTACHMWEAPDKLTPESRWEVFKMMAAQYIRKLVPSKGVYEDAGFTEQELAFKPL